ncbi:right-handed parallel beta-helix repeat-containing protein [Rhizobium sp. Root1220]|uniref:right-handed parallel beta-helix repeat-containing protein n=1 Tax=Rhizobium sp. Root1220 TaxID=1736432 RepID=UPI0007017B42|nr:right-handed parallel beta-helix repeat-containing protein [Rhizobium sp. Root1220]KQV83654.1 hypothetical protein ASC90_20435 [Rhizobium sp. Root1220]
MASSANQVYRDYITDGIPSSGNAKVKKAEVRALLSGYESIISAFTSNGGLIYSSLALLNADLTKAANSMAWVVGDATAANNGVYGKVGGIGVGSWTRRSDLPFSFIIGTDAGAGTPNALQVTTSLPVSGSALVILNVFEANTASPVTVSFNGGSALTIKSNSGNDIVSAGLAAGMLLFGYVSGSTFRLISDQVSSAIVAAAEAAAAAAAASAASINLPAIGSGNKGKGLTINAAETGYDQNLLSIVALTRTALKALTTSIDRPVYLAESGREGVFKLRAGSPPVTDTQEGIYVVSNTASFYWERVYGPTYPTVRAFGAALDGTTDDSNALKGAIAVLGIAIVPYTSTGFVADGVDINPSLGHILKAEVRTLWKLKAASTYAIKVLPASVAQNYAHIENFIFDGAAAANTAGAILINTSAGIVSGLRARRLIFRDCGFAYKEETHASNFVVDFAFEDCECFYTRGRQVFSNRSRGFFRWREFRINNGYNAPAGRPTVTWNSAYFGDMLGLEFFCFDVVGDVPGAPTNLPYQATAVGLIIDGVVGGRGSIYGNRVLIDSTCGPGIQMSNVFNVELDEVQAYSNLGPAIALTSVSKSNFGKMKVVGGKGVTNAAASAHGIAMTSCSFVILDGLEADNNTGAGCIMTGCSDCQVLGGYSINNSTYGYYDDTGSRNRRVGVTATGNTTASLFQNVASSATYSWTPNSGTPTASTIGVATV